MNLKSTQKWLHTSLSVYKKDLRIYKLFFYIQQRVSCLKPGSPQLKPILMEIEKIPKLTLDQGVVGQNRETPQVR